MWFLQLLQESASDTELTSLDCPPFIACVGCAKYFTIFEMEITVRNIDNMAEAVIIFFALHYNLDICYAQQKRRNLYFLEFIQKILFGLERNKLSPRLTSLMSSLKRLQS